MSKMLCGYCGDVREYPQDFPNTTMAVCAPCLVKREALDHMTKTWTRLEKLFLAGCMIAIACGVSLVLTAIFSRTCP